MQRPPIEQAVTFLYVDDLARTAQFYEQVLGLNLALDQGNCRIYQVAGSAYVGFCERAGAQPNGVIVTLVSADVDSWYSYLQSHNIVIEKTPQHNPNYNIYHLFIRDPQGYLLEIQTFQDPAWPRDNHITV